MASGNTHLTMLFHRLEDTTLSLQSICNGLKSRKTLTSGIRDRQELRNSCGRFLSIKRAKKK